MNSTEIYTNEIKERLLNFKIDGIGKVWLFAKFLIEDLQMAFYFHEIYNITNEMGFRVKRLPISKQIHQSYFLQYIGILQSPYKKILKEKINEAIWECDSNGSSFADMLCEITKEKEREYCEEIGNEENFADSLFLSGDEEAEECNNQFNSIMNDFDAWRNIDD